MAVQVCDAIMGTGKSQSAITWMNEHPNDKFIYITPYLNEASRIRRSCPNLGFLEPSDKIKEYHFSKCEHTAALIHEGRNITTTHQAFKRYTPEMLCDIREKQYTLIIDEDMDILEPYAFHPDDLAIAVNVGLVKCDGGVYSAVDSDYNGYLFRELIRLLHTRDLIGFESDEERQQLFCYWSLPPQLITSFHQVFILTYLFSGQSLHHMLEIYHIPYSYIGVQQDDMTETGFRFSVDQYYIPEYVSNLESMIHIVESARINRIGEDRYALSMGWFRRGNGVDQLQRNISNCFKNIWSGTPTSRKLWSTYDEERNRLSDNGYRKAFLTFNAKATNEYRRCTHLAYLVNLFMNVIDKRVYQKCGFQASDDLYALSIMIQWIWRSAIRDGKEIYLYIPSSRMRNLLKDWIETVSKGGSLIGT